MIKLTTEELENIIEIKDIENIEKVLNKYNLSYSNDIDGVAEIKIYDDDIDGYDIYLTEKDFVRSDIIVINLLDKHRLWIF